MAGAGNPKLNVTPMPSQQPGPNVFSQSAGALQRGIQMAGGGGGGFSPVTAVDAQVSGVNPSSIGAIGVGTAAGGIPDYMNPYTQDVIDTSMADLERQRLMQQNVIGAQAGQAGAFGGSRQGVAEALTNEAFARQGGQLAAGLRQQGFETALGAAQQDAENRLQAQLQAQTLGGQMSMANLDARTRTALANQQAQLEAQRLNQQAALEQGQQAIQGAGVLGQLSNLGFGQGMDITRQQQAQGLAMQALNQQLIDAARQQYAGFTGEPTRALQLPIAAVSAGNMGQGTTTGTTSQQPGLFDYLSLGASTLGGLAKAGVIALGADPRLKTNVKPYAKRDGI